MESTNKNFLNYELFYYVKEVDDRLLKIVELVDSSNKDYIENLNKNSSKLIVEALRKLEFDYIIITSLDRFYMELRKNLYLLGIPYNKIIPAPKGRYDIIKTQIENRENLPRWDTIDIREIHLQDRLRLKNTDFSFVSDDCWSIFMYNQLGLEYSSPLLGTYLDSKEYFKLLSNLKYYLTQKLEIIEDPEYDYVVAMLDDVKIRFPHEKSPTKALMNWNRRIQRFNWNNFYVKANLPSEEYAKKFDSLPFKNKIGFSKEPYPYKSCIHLDKYKEIYPYIPAILNDYTYFAFFYTPAYVDMIAWLNGSDNYIK